MRGDVDTIKERLNITEIVSGYIKLEKAGTSFKARCPFHNEKTPSFFVSPARQSFYCFGCGAKGDIFTFVEEMDGLDFRGTLKLLAEKAGVEIKYQVSGESRAEKDKILNVLEQATKFFEKELTDDRPTLFQATKFFEKELADHRSVRQYLASRGISEETVRNWRIGYAPGPSAGGWRALREYMNSLGYNDTVLLKAGLIKKSGDDAKS